MNIIFNLNEVLWIAFIAGMVLNWAIESWIWKWKEVIGSFFCVALAYAITEIPFLLSMQPQQTITKIIYVIGFCIFAFSPIEIFKTIKTGGREGLITWIKHEIKKKTETETITKTETEIITNDKPKDNNAGN